MWLLMTNTTYSTFSSPLASPIAPAGLVLSRPAGVCEAPTNRGNYTQARLFVRDPSPLVLLGLSFFFRHALPEYRPIFI